MDNVMYYICYPLGYIMKWCREQVGNYGLAIILFTLVTKLVILPVSVWVHKNSIRMVSIQPEINRLKAKFYGDRERIAEEQTALYRQVGYNPFANSIPLLIQLLPLAAGRQYHPGTGGRPRRQRQGGTAGNRPGGGGGQVLRPDRRGSVVGGGGDCHPRAGYVLLRA